MDYSAFPLPKPGKRVKPEVKKDGRTVLNARNYRQLRQRVHDRANGRCERCKQATPLGRGDLHHRKKRKMGGGERQDTLENSAWLCRSCHFLVENGKAEI